MFSAAPLYFVEGGQVMIATDLFPVLLAAHGPNDWRACGAPNGWRCGLFPALGLFRFRLDGQDLVFCFA